MAVRVGVDVGGTFTKAVAVDLEAGSRRRVGAADHPRCRGGRGGGRRAVRCRRRRAGRRRSDRARHPLDDAGGERAARGRRRHGRHASGWDGVPSSRKARKRTELSKVELSAGQARSRRVPEFLDVTDGLDPAAAAAALERLRGRGRRRPSRRRGVRARRRRNETRGRGAGGASSACPSCASTELSGLYGLELRAVTAAINASILPIALRTAELVEEGVARRRHRRAGHGDARRRRRDRPRRLPARARAHALLGPGGVGRRARCGTRASRDGVVVEVGGTSTNVAAIKRGGPRSPTSGRDATRPRCARSTCGSSASPAARCCGSRRGQVYGVGPRSAHIAGLPYACFADAARFDGRAPSDRSRPRPGDPADYLVLELADGTPLALTNTCAANAARRSPSRATTLRPTAAAAAPRSRSPAARAPAAEEVARRMLHGVAASGRATSSPRSPTSTGTAAGLVAVGGGAGGLGRQSRRMLGLKCVVPDGAEVISSIGDALSLVRAERERTVFRGRSARRRSTSWSPRSKPRCSLPVRRRRPVEVLIEEQPDKGTVRAVATGSDRAAGGCTSRTPRGDRGRGPTAAAAPLGGGDVRAAGSFWLAVQPTKVAGARSVRRFRGRDHRGRCGSSRRCRRAGRQAHEVPGARSRSSRPCG